MSIWIIIPFAIIILYPIIADIIWGLGTKAIREINSQPTEVWVKNVEIKE